LSYRAEKMVWKEKKDPAAKLLFEYLFISEIIS